MKPHWITERRSLLVCLLLVVATLTAYWPVRLNDFVIYDDQDYVIQNAEVRSGLSWHGVAWAFQSHHANWHPLTWLSHMLDCQVFGLNPAGHHVTSLVLHLANTLLLFLVFARMTGAFWRSAFVAGLFALHPMHVESVAWVAERKDLLSAFFGLLSLGAYFWYTEAKSLPRPAGGSSESKIRRAYCLAVVCFTLALMSKPMLVTLPCLLLLLDFWPLRRFVFQHPRRETLSGLIVEKLPFFVLSAACVAVTLATQQVAMEYYQDLPLSARIANALISCVRYIAKTFWPQNLAVLYPHPAHWPGALVAFSSIALAALTGLAAHAAHSRPYVVVGWFWFLIGLLPALGLIQVGVQAMADRYTYLPVVGIFVMVTWLVGDWVSSRRTVRSLCAVLAVLILVGCALATRVQLRVWRDTETLFTHAVQVTANNWVAHFNLALLAMRRYQDLPLHSPQGPESSNLRAREYLDEVVEHCSAVLRSRPGFPDAQITLAKALTEQGLLEDAEAQLESAVASAPKSPEARQNLAEIFHRQHRLDEAAEQYRLALALRPDWAPVLNNLGWLLATHPAGKSHGPEAVRLAERACVLNSFTNLSLLHTLAAAYAQDGDFSRAVNTAEQAQRLAQSTSDTNLIEQAQARLELFKSGRPLRDP